MKKFISFFISLLFVSISIFIVSAHPGGTDYKGGHRDSDTGIYHYHHGYSAHQHPNGECPYDFDDKTASNVNNDVSKDIYKKSENFTTESDVTFDIFLIIVKLIPISLVTIIFIIPSLGWFYDYLREKIKKS